MSQTNYGELIKFLETLINTPHTAQLTGYEKELLEKILERRKEEQKLQRVEKKL